MEVRRLAAEGRFDYLLIESTGISEPLPVAETFTFRDEQGRSLADQARLDTMVTVVDGVNFLRDFHAAESLAAWLDVFTTHYLSAKRSVVLDREDEPHQRLRALAAQGHETSAPSSGVAWEASQTTPGDEA